MKIQGIEGKEGEGRMRRENKPFSSGNVITKAKKQERKFPKGVREHIDRVLELGETCRRKYLEYYETE